MARDHNNETEDPLAEMCSDYMRSSKIKLFIWNTKRKNIFGIARKPKKETGRKITINMHTYKLCHNDNRSVRNYRTEERIIPYLDETWTSEGSVLNKSWQDTNVKNERDISIG